jgi:hypothetical protein
MSKSFDDRWERDLEREPTYVGRPRPVIALSVFGTVKQYIERSKPVSRCSVCEKPTAGLRCAECQARNAQRVDCECGFLYEGEAHTCKEAA